MEALIAQVEHEHGLLRTWLAGDTSSMPPGWTADMQRYFVRGMVHALEILRMEEDHFE